MEYFGLMPKVWSNICLVINKTEYVNIRYIQQLFRLFIEMSGCVQLIITPNSCVDATYLLVMSIEIGNFDTNTSGYPNDIVSYY